jgi:hypothetical protein
MERVSGEKVQERCDYFIGTDYDVNYNPYIKEKLLFKWIPIGSSYLTNFKNAKKIFCYTHLLYSHLKEVLDILAEIAVPFDIYFGNSDGNFLELHFKSLKTIKNIQKMYPQNNTIVDPQVITLPIGLANRQWPHGKQELLNNIETTKTENIFLNFDITTNATRGRCKEILLAKGLQWIPNNSYQDYLKILGKHHFCICVEGNGHDTHRFWECLYLKVVPIVLKSDWTRTMVGKVPMIVLDNWESLNVNLVYNWEINEKVIDLNYYF